MTNFYAVARGRKPGIYATWDECKEQVHKFPDARYKKFSSKREAEEFNAKNSSSNSSTFAMSSTSSKFTMFSSTSVTSRKRAFPETKDDVALSKSARISVGSSTVVVYTDGACSSNGKKHAVAGVGVFWGDDHPDNVSEPLMSGPQTNNRAEYQAVVRALEIAHDRKHPSLQICTDSKLLVRSMNDWLTGWKNRNWVTAAGTPVKNRDLLEKIDALRKKVRVEFVHVAGHSGIYENEKADELARGGIRRNN